MRILFSILVFAIISCGTTPGWITIEGKGLPDQDVTYKALHFINSDTAYLGGSHIKLPGHNKEKANFSFNGILFKSENQGKHWVNIQVPNSKSVDKIFSRGHTLVLALETENGGTTLVVSNDYGKLWKTVLNLNDPVQIVDGDFLSNGSFIVLARDTNFNYVIKYNEKLDTLTVFENSIKGAVVGNKVFSLIDVGSLGLNAGYGVYDIKTGQTSKVGFDAEYYVESYSKHDSSLYLAANRNGNSCILNLGVNDYEKIHLGKYSEYVLSRVFASGRKLFAIAHTQEHVGPIGVTESLLISDNGGATWHIEEPPFPLCIETPTIFSHESFMYTCGPMIYVRY